MKKAKIAVVTLGHYIYFDQFDGLKAELSQKTAQFINYIDTDKCDVFDVGYVDCADEAFEAVKKLKKEDADLLFVLLSTYVPSAVCAPFARYIDIPHVLVGIQPLNHLDYSHTTTYMQLANDDICAMPEIAGVYERMGRDIPPCIVAASSQTDAIKKELDSWADAALAMASFKYETFGYLGHTYEGMYDMHTDPTAFFAAFGSHVKMLEICELAKLTEAITDTEIEEHISEITDIFQICDPSVDPLTDYVKREDLEYSARISAALKKLVQNNNLAALAYYYKSEPNNPYEQLAANLIIGNTLLTSSGIPLAGEADLKTAAAMLIMKNIGGGGSFAEIHPFDVTDDVVLIGHDGPHNIAIAEGKPRLRKLKKYHGKSGSGIGVEFSLKAGPVTLLSINVDRNGKFRMIAAEGVSIAGEIPQTGNTNTRVSFGCPVCEFLSRWCEAGPTHHLALGIGHHMETLRKFSKMSGIDLIEVKGEENV
ncbi:MAG: L-fucose/L-arabinose isomerase family protein [Clostridia bacterium]|nr:L-fucose/L-arabinose isomerase family protein [Clostridia bacterium]